MTSVIFPLFAFLVVLAARFLFHLCKRRTKFANIPGPKSISWGGSYAWLNDPTRGWDFFHHTSQTYGGLVKISGPLLCDDMLYISDPLAAMHIVRKNEDDFDKPPEVHLMLRLMLGTHGITSTCGQEHARRRRYLNPLFHPSRLRQLPPLFYEASQRTLSSLKQLTADGPAAIDMCHWGNRLILEFVGQGIAGHSFDTLKVGDKPNLYGENLKQGFLAISTAEARLAIKYIVPRILPAFPTELNRRLMALIPNTTANRLNKFIHNLSSTSKALFASKKSAMIHGECEDGKDILSGLVRDLMLDPKKDQISDEEGMSHLAALLFAATDTSSSALSRLLFTLAHHPEIQLRLRKEIIKARESKNGHLDYDTVMSLPILNAVFLETMRLYPPAPYVERVATKDIMLPLAHPIQGLDGTSISQVFLPEGTNVTISLIGLNRNKNVWGPDAEEWNPDRWLKVDEGGKGAVKDDRMPGISSRIMTFLDGDRHCMGWRFAHLELKIAISELLQSFSFSLVEGVDQEVHWPMGITLSPFVGDKMSMPLVVSPLSS